MLALCQPWVHDPGGVVDTTPPIASRLRLRMFPNPLLGKGWFSLDLAREGEVLIDVFDASGRRVARPTGAQWVSLSEGTWNLRWDPRRSDGARLPAGTYLVRVRGRDGAGSYNATGKWMLLR